MRNALAALRCLRPTRLALAYNERVDKGNPSRTALSTSLMRALHSRSDPHPVIQDPWGDRLVPPDFRETLPDELLARSPAFANVITRTRFTEDALQAAVARGARQYVLIGAGFDSFALRIPDYARQIEVFELDHPATQELKLRRIRDCNLDVPSTVHFIAVNFAEESVAGALARSPFRSDRLSFFSWLGVTMYLTREANLATLKSVAAFALPDSELVFTYMDEQIFASKSASFLALQERVAAMGEPFLSGFDPRSLAQELLSCGLELREDLSDEQTNARYGRPDWDVRERPSHSHIARAGVVANSHRSVK
jgi:methyltransferase (TIGR00027 family)